MKPFISLDMAFDAAASAVPFDTYISAWSMNSAFCMIETARYRCDFDCLISR